MLHPIALRLPNKRGQLRARLSGLRPTRNQSRSAIHDPTRRKPRRNARSTSKEFAARAVKPYAKAAKVSPDGLCVAFLRGGAPRRSVIERGASSCLDALPQLGAGVLPVYRANDPRLLSSVNGGVADQASTAVLNVNCADQIADTALVQPIDVGGIPINGRRKSSPTGPFVVDFVEKDRQ